MTHNTTQSFISFHICTLLTTTMRPAAILTRYIGPTRREREGSCELF